MDFAKKQLEKYGWRDGKGLGKNEDGISEALKPKLKFDNGGIGHQVGDQFTNNWWERLFNNASKNINVNVEEDEVKLQLNSEPVEITTKNYSLKELKKNEHLHYGSFLKTAKITQNGTQNYKVAPPEPLPSFTNLTDDELFAACGGRTAHKGARHGLKLSGKLSRIEKQEKFLLKKMKNVSLKDDTSILEKKMKKLKKHKEETITDTIEESEGSSSSSHKKKKNKRKSVTFNNETIVKYYTPDLDTSHESNKDENSNSQVLVDPNSNDEGIEQDIEDSGNDPNDHSSFEEPQRTFSDLSKAERKKLKKKRKLEKKKTATSQFIEEVRETMCLEENCKKRKLLEGFDELDLEKQKIKEHSKKKKYVPEKLRKKEEKRERKIMKSIVQSMDNFCRISDDE